MAGKSKMRLTSSQVASPHGVPCVILRQAIIALGSDAQPGDISWLRLPSCHTDRYTLSLL